MNVKNEICNLQNILVKLTKGRDNLNLLLGNQRAYYNKVGIDYKSNNNSKNFINICNSKTTSHCKTLKWNYCNKESHVVMFWFIKKIQERKEGYSLSYFYKKHCEPKMKNVYALSNTSNIKSNDKNVYETNNRWPKMIWVPKFKTWVFIVGMLYNLER